MCQPYGAELVNNQVAGTISVVIPSYGHAHYIQQTLESLFQQTRQPLEIIVINDGSPDDTASAVQPYLDRIRYIEQTNRGLNATLNVGLTLCRGDYVLMIASDDWLRPDALEMLAAILDINQYVGFVHAEITYVDEDGMSLSHLVPRSLPPGSHRATVDLIKSNYIYAPTVLCRRSALNAVGEFLDFTFCQDWAMWLRLLFAGWYAYGIDQPLAYYRRHSSNLTHKSRIIEALQDEVNMLRYVRSLQANLSSDENRAFNSAIQERLLSLGWHGLFKNWHSISRRAFLQLLAERPTVNGLIGLIFAFLPNTAFSLASRTNRRLHLLVSKEN